MLAGVGPLLNTRTAGYFLFPTGLPHSWEYAEGVASQNDRVVVRMNSPYRVRDSTKRIAILADSAVASSGEAIVLAFRHQGNVRTFGQPTCGLASAKMVFKLSDGAVLNLANGWMADRTRSHDSGRPIVPDELISDQRLAIERVVAWLHTGR